MEDLEIKKGWVIDRANSTSECIRFKREKLLGWREGELLDGYRLDKGCCPLFVKNYGRDNTSRNIFATKKQAEASLALAMLTQQVKDANGDWEPNWMQNFSGTGDYQWVIEFTYYCPEGKAIQEIVGPRLLEFQTKKIAEEFLECNRDLIKEALPLSI
ncbi:hypothetical protein [uncultured Gammaproteobacteria bacterium]|nr:hypothetical protein [uncultured Gammaproteobacteria bacterium]CAC9986607.1 hypothetical protein [uncultured Gammaproteobacteria bacterium]